MDPRVSFITLAVRDRAATRRFYVDGLGWTPDFDAEDVIMIRVADRVILSLWDAASFSAEVGGLDLGDLPPVTLAHNVATAAAVDEVVAQARAAGATSSGEPAERARGGYTDYFADPDGYRWEVAFNPGAIGRSVRALAAHDVDSVEALARWSRSEVAAWQGVGPSALGVWDTALDDAGLEWGAE